MDEEREGFALCYEAAAAASRWDGLQGNNINCGITAREVARKELLSMALL